MSGLHRTNMPLKPGDPLVSFLPLAHTYGCAFEFLFPFTFGCHITILSKTPSPQIIVQAFKEIKPRLILSVPLVIEKIFKKQLLPVISKPHMKILLAIPGINKIIFIKRSGKNLLKHLEAGLKRLLLEVLHLMLMLKDFSEKSDSDFRLVMG